jgi:hypothetical protein
MGCWMGNKLNVCDYVECKSRLPLPEDGFVYGK